MADGSILQATKYPNVEEVCIGEFVLRLEPHAAQLYVSQPEPAPGFPRQRDTFMYPTSAGENITVYVWDTGAMVEHEAIENAGSSIRSIHCEFDLERKEEDFDPTGGHGTPSVDVIAGQENGMARNVDVVVCHEPRDVLTPEDEISPYIKLWRQIIADVRKRKLHGRAIISVSVCLDAFGGSEQETEAYREIGNELADLGVLIIAAARNHNVDPIDPAGLEFPQCMAKDLPMVIVGGDCDDYCVRKHHRNRENPDVGCDINAPETVPRAACTKGINTYESFVGTSAATAQVTAVAACLGSQIKPSEWEELGMNSLRKVAEGLKEALIFVAHPREGRPPLLYNDVPWLECERLDKHHQRE